MPKWAILFILAIFLLCTAVTAPAGEVKTGPRPGKSEPFMGVHHSIFSDDELFIAFDLGFTPGDNGNTDFGNLDVQWTTAAPTSDDLTHWQILDEGSHAYDFQHWGATWVSKGGRITDFTNDQVFFTAANVHYAGSWNRSFATLYEYGSGFNTNYEIGMTAETDYVYDAVTADLDGIADENGNYFDEIVVVRPYYEEQQGGSIEQNPRVLILDRNFQEIDSFRLPEFGTILKTAVGDFSGDGTPEIAVAVIDFHNKVTLYIIDVDRSEKTLSFTQVCEYSETFPKDYMDADFAAGDFNGDGKDDLAVTTESEVRVYSVTPSESSDWVIARKGTIENDPGLTKYSLQLKLRMASGLFYLYPGYGLNRKQLAIVYEICNQKEMTCKLFQIHDDYSLEMVEKQTFARTTLDPPGYNLGYASSPIDVAVGNFRGHGIDGNQTSPLDQLAIGFWFPEAGSSNKSLYVTPKVYVWDLVDVDTKPGGSITTAYSGENKTVFCTGCWPPSFDGSPGLLPPITVAAYDCDGDSYLLGEPMHIVVDNNISLDYVIQEPPKHVDYLPKDPTNPDSDWEVVNVSGSSEFYVQFKDSQETTFKTEDKNKSDWTIGGSASLDVKGTISAGDVLGLEKLSISAESKTKLSYKYDEKQSDWNSQYSTREISHTSNTDVDDFIWGNLQLLDIWRFPILGYTSPVSTAPHGIMDVVVPGPKLSFQANGLDHSDWYQPVHQNKNLLSYPSLNNPDFPLDKGSFTLPDGTEVNDTMNPMDVHTYGGDSHSLSLKWTDEAGAGSKKKYKHTLGESEDVKTGVSGKATWEAGSVEASTEVDIGFSNRNSLGGTSTSECTNTESKGITIEVPFGDSDKSYTFKSAVYVDANTGKLKVAHAVDPLGSTAGNLWWLDQYGRKPDPALNLPMRIMRRGEDYELNKETGRMEMRGFFMRKNKPDPTTGEYQVIGGPPKEGEIVRLCANIYNFALNDTTGEFEVLFESVKVNSVGDEVAPRETIGSVRTSLEPYDSTNGRPLQEVHVEWDTQGKYDAQYGYRFYVTIDPNDEVPNELHEWKDAEGNKVIHGNNEGYWPWIGGGIHVLKANSSSVATRVGQADISSHAESLAIELDGEFLTAGPVIVDEGNQYLLRANIQSDDDMESFQTVLFSEGPPDEGSVFSIRRASIVEGENYVWARWTPRVEGEYTLYVHVLEHEDEPGSGDATDELTVTVRNAADGDGGGGCFISTTDSAWRGRRR